MAIPWNFEFFVVRVYNEKLGHILKPLVPKFRPDLSARLKDIAEKRVPAKLKPIVCRCAASALKFSCCGPYVNKARITRDRCRFSPYHSQDRQNMRINLLRRWKRIIHKPYHLVQKAKAWGWMILSYGRCKLETRTRPASRQSQHHLQNLYFDGWSQKQLYTCGRTMYFVHMQIFN